MTPKQKKLIVSVPEGFHKKLRTLASWRGISLKTLVISELSETISEAAVDGELPGNIEHIGKKVAFVTK